MPIQAPSWTDFLTCPVCCNEFAANVRVPISLGCGHTICRLCLTTLHNRQCPCDQTTIATEIDNLPINYALLQLVGDGNGNGSGSGSASASGNSSSAIINGSDGSATNAKDNAKELSLASVASASSKIIQKVPESVRRLCPEDLEHYQLAKTCIENLALHLKSIVNNANLLTRPMQRKIVTLVNCQLMEEEGRVRALRAARSLGERTVTELILQHQNPQQLSSNLWAAVRSRGCQFLGPAMQEEVLKLVLLALEEGSALSRKVLVMFVVQRLELKYPQASKTSIGHVVQLLYRASCFKVSKRESDSSLMQLKEDFRTYDALRREHDAQIVQIATEAGLRIGPEQWSTLLYGDILHKSHMQSIIDKLQTPSSFSQSVQELVIALARTNDPANLAEMQIHFKNLSSIDPCADNATLKEVALALTAAKQVVVGLVNFLQLHGNRKLQDCVSGGQLISTAKYKISLCRDLTIRRMCPRGTGCTFAHSEEELERYRVKNRVKHMKQQFTPNTVQHGSLLMPKKFPNCSDEMNSVPRICFAGVNVNSRGYLKAGGQFQLRQMLNQTNEKQKRFNHMLPPQPHSQPAYGPAHSPVLGPPSMYDAHHYAGNANYLAPPRDFTTRVSPRPSSVLSNRAGTVQDLYHGIGGFYDKRAHQVYSGSNNNNIEGNELEFQPKMNQMEEPPWGSFPTPHMNNNVSGSSSSSNSMLRSNPDCSDMLGLSSSTLGNAFYDIQTQSQLNSELDLNKAMADMSMTGGGAAGDHYDRAHDFELADKMNDDYLWRSNASDNPTLLNNSEGNATNFVTPNHNQTRFLRSDSILNDEDAIYDAPLLGTTSASNKYGPICPQYKGGLHGNETKSLTESWSNGIIDESLFYPSKNLQYQAFVTATGSDSQQHATMFDSDACSRDDVFANFDAKSDYNNRLSFMNGGSGAYYYKMPTEHDSSYHWKNNLELEPPLTATAPNSANYWKNANSIYDVSVNISLSLDEPQGTTDKNQLVNTTSTDDSCDGVIDNGRMREIERALEEIVEVSSNKHDCIDSKLIDLSLKITE